MPSSINALEIYKRLGKENWKPPTPWGPGFVFKSRSKGQIIVTPMDDFEEFTDEWFHASISRVDEMPSYYDLKLMHDAVFGGGFSYQIFVPPSQHINFHEFALHLWGRADGKPVLPDFGEIFYKRFGVRMV